MLDYKVFVFREQKVRNVAITGSRKMQREARTAQLFPVRVDGIVSCIYQILFL